jgi:hypothetical protein
MQKQVAEQIGVGVNHPCASGKFDIAHSVEGSTYVAQLNFYSKLKDSDGFECMRYCTSWTQRGRSTGTRSDNGKWSGV